MARVGGNRLPGNRYRESTRRPSLGDPLHCHDIQLAEIHNGRLAALCAEKKAQPQGIKKRWDKRPRHKRRCHKETIPQNKNLNLNPCSDVSINQVGGQAHAEHKHTQNTQAHAKYTCSLLPCAPPYTPAVQALGHIGLIVFVPTKTLHEARVAVCTLRVACERASERARERARERERSSESPAREQVRERDTPSRCPQPQPRTEEQGARQMDRKMMDKKLRGSMHQRCYVMKKEINVA